MLWTAKDPSSADTAPTEQEKQMPSRTWLVTGSARGLGRAISLAALEHGDRVVATARRPEQLADLVDRFGDRVRAVTLDVTDPGAADAAGGAAVEAFGGLGGVVNNAGYAHAP